MARRGIGAGLLASFALVSVARADAPKQHRLMLHVDSDDAAVMALALGNLSNAIDAFADQKEPARFELVVNGPGYAMLRDTSPVRDRIAEIHKQYPAVVFSACQNSRRGIANKEGKTVAQVIQLSEAASVPAGVVRICELQQQGWSYMKV